MSFNYHRDNKICELSSLYPESSAIEDGWTVYGHIVDGVWGNWMNLGSCSVSCGAGTRSMSRLCDNPSPSNGGNQCQGPNVENQACNDGSCLTFVNGYHMSKTSTSWQNAKSICESASARLVVITSQTQINTLISYNNNQKLNHWIGMTCTLTRQCWWINGQLVSSGFQAWAPNEPQGSNCVYIGYMSNQWDDTSCSMRKYYICQKQVFPK